MSRFFKKKVQLCESHYKKKKAILWAICFTERGSILWIIFKKCSIPWVIKKFGCWSQTNLLGSNSLSPFVKRVQFFESNFGKSSSILWVILKRVQICDFLKKDKDFFLKGSILWVNFYFTTSSILCVMFYFKKVQLFETYSQMFHVNHAQLFESCWKDSFNSLSHTQKQVQFFEYFCKEFNSLSQTFWKNGFNSVSHVEKKGSIFMSHVGKKGSILCIIWKNWFSSVSHEKTFNSFSQQKSFFYLIDIFQKINSSRHLFLFFFQKRSILWDSFSNRRFKSSSDLLKEDSIPWVILKKRFNSLSHIQFFESDCKKKQSLILSVVLKKGSILWIKLQKFNPLSHIEKFESF